MKLNLQPLDDRVIIELAEPDRISPGGIIIPDKSQQRKTDRGIVLAVGPGALLKGQVVATESKYYVDETASSGTPSPSR
jgi:co-chaperonin GroES (HSP10)